QRELFARGDAEADAAHDLLGAKAHRQVLYRKQRCGGRRSALHRRRSSAGAWQRCVHWSAFRGSSASRSASPMKVSSSSVVTSTAKVDSEIHHASMLFLPWLSSSPSDGVP